MTDPCDVCLRRDEEHSEHDRKRCKAIVRIVALSEVSVERGATPGEQAAAETTGLRIIQRYGLTLDEVSAYVNRQRAASRPVPRPTPPPRPTPVSFGFGNATGPTVNVGAGGIWITFT